MTVKVIKRKQPIMLGFEDSNGEVHEMSLPGELSIVARLKIEELHSMDETVEFSQDDLFNVFDVILGESNARNLIYQWNASETQLQEVIVAYIEELGNRQTSPNVEPQSQTQSPKKKPSNRKQ